MKQVRTIRAITLEGKRVFVRVDFNVPLSPAGKITDDTRIQAALPTIRYLLEKKAIPILGSHLGRPKGKRNEAYSLKPVADHLAELLEYPVLFFDDCIGEEIEASIRQLSPGSLVLLENLRFHAEEEANDLKFSQQLARLAEIYVNDAFGTAHRAHASTAGMPSLMSVRVAGFLMQKELEFLGDKTENPEKPFTVILGGAKVSDKIKVINALLEKADRMLIGGAMAYTFLLAKGMATGNSLVEKDCLQLAQQALDKAAKKDIQFLLPIDHIATDKVDFQQGQVGDLHTITTFKENQIGIDIGPKTVELFREVISSSKTILWNGPMGIFELTKSAQGTFAIAEAVARSKALSIIGGGDSIKALKKSGYADQVSFMSTGGGASLEFLEGEELPGVQILEAIL